MPGSQSSSGGVREAWHVAPFLAAGTLRDPEPAWVDPSDPAPTAAAFRLQARVARAVVRELGLDAGKLLSARLSGGRGHGIRSVQGKLSGEYTLHPADLARWMDVLPLSREDLGTPDELAGLAVEWQPVIAAAGPVAYGPKWPAVAARLAALLAEEAEAGRLRLAGPEAVAYLALQSLTADGTSARQIRRTADGGWDVRAGGRSVRVAAAWHPDGDDKAWEQTLHSLHLRLGTLAGVPAADRVAVLCLGLTATALLDVWEPPPDTAPCPGPLSVPASVLENVDAGAGPLGLELLARERWSGGWVLVTRAQPG